MKSRTAWFRPFLGLLLCIAWHTCGALDTHDFGLDSDVVQNETDFTCTPKPPPKPPAQHSSAEGLPPLPLPAVPLRRTEKKNPPRPPVLIAKISTQRRSDWATNPSDTRNLLTWMAQNLNVHFSSINLPEDQLPADATGVPVLYRTGHDAFEFSEETRTRLRAYLLSGGTLILDACCGRAAFVRSALREMQLLIPERPPYRLSLDHPLYHAYFEATDVHYRAHAKEAGAVDGVPGCIGIDIGCRTAVFFFRWDMSCGWDQLADDDHHHCLGYTIETSRRLGTNLMAYITAERSAAMPLSQAMRFVDANAATSGKFVIAQARYRGNWKTREAGLSMLLNTFHEQTTTPVRFQTEQVALDSPRLFEVPFVYMTGHQAFELTDDEARNLRQYLLRGGVLLGEACCGRTTFDQAFRAQMRRVLPEVKLEPLDKAHPVFRYPNRIEAVTPRPALARALEVEGPIPPRLLAAALNGNLAVIYSPFGLCCGWELAQCPYCRGIQGKDSLALGVNILTYVLMQ